MRAGVKVAFVDADRHGDVLVPRDGGDPVQQERVRHRVHVGGQEHEAVDIRDGRTHKAVAPGRQAFDHAGLPRDGDLRHVADQGRTVLLAEVPPGLAFDQARRGADGVKAAQGADNPSGLPISHQNSP